MPSLITNPHFGNQEMGEAVRLDLVASTVAEAAPSRLPAEPQPVQLHVPVFNIDGVRRIGVSGGTNTAAKEPFILSCRMLTGSLVGIELREVPGEKTAPLGLPIKGYHSALGAPASYFGDRLSECRGLVALCTSIDISDEGAAVARMVAETETGAITGLSGVATDEVSPLARACLKYYLQKVN